MLSVKGKYQAYTTFTSMILRLSVLIKMILILEALRLLKTRSMFFVKVEWIEETYLDLLRLRRVQIKT